MAKKDVRRFASDNTNYLTLVPDKEFLLIRLTFIFALVAALLCGCTHSFHNKADVNDSTVSTVETAPPVCKWTSAGHADDAHSESVVSEEGILVYATPTNGGEGWDHDSNGDVSALKENQAILDKALDFCQASQDFWQKGELESAIEALDQAYALIQEVDTEASPKLIQGKDDLRFLISKRILEIYASRNMVVNGTYNAIPITINKHVQKEINLFTTGNEKNFFLQSYQRSGMYRARMVEALKEAGLPVELSWLPLIESGFKVKALSRARALGLWQFIPSTGYKFGLKRDMFIDERIDPEKSTQAAIAYLKELHNMFGDWITVLAAYNCGEGRVLRVIRSQNVNYLDNFWDLYERLPRETARYVPRFLATLHIMANLETYGLESVCIDPPLVYEKIMIDKQVKLTDVAKSIGQSGKALEELNPELRYKIVPPGPYALKVPARHRPDCSCQASRNPALVAATAGLCVSPRATGRNAFHTNCSAVSYQCRQDRPGK